MGLYELKELMGLSFIVRSGTVDTANLKWMQDSMFLNFLVASPITEDSCVLDFGSHIGGFSLPAARKTNCRVVGFEPDEDSLRISRANGLLNNLYNRVEFVECAISGSDGTADLLEANDNWGHTLVEGGGPYNVLTGSRSTVRVLSLASAIGYATGGDIFVKFNIEGSEFDMFENSSVATLGQIAGFIGEIHYDIGKRDIEPSLLKLNKAGFKTELISQGDTRAILVASKKSSSGLLRNVR